MTKNIFKAFSALFLCTFAICANAGLEMLSTNIIELGKIYKFAKSTNEFNFVNTGTTDIKVLELISTCPCIYGKQDKDIIRPGEKFTLETHFNAQKVHGLFSRGVWLVTDAPAQQRVLVKVNGEIIPLFKGIPSEEIILQSEDNSTIFTNTFTLEGTTTNYFINAPTPPSYLKVSATLTKLKAAENSYTLTTIIDPQATPIKPFSISLPVNGPAAVDDEEIKFKFIIGADLKISPSRLVVSSMARPLVKKFYINTYSPEEQTDELKWEPQIEGVEIQVEAFVRKREPEQINTVNKKSRSSATHNVRYSCTATISPEALAKIMAMDEPGFTFSYPDHKSAKMPLITLKPRTRKR